jgi:hypothetical protein
MQIGPKGDVTGGLKFFEKSPFRSYFFFFDTVLLNLSVLSGIRVLVRHHDQLPTITQFSVYLVIAGMLMLWNASIRAHRRIHRLYQGGAILGITPGSPLENTIRVAAGMLHLGLAYTFGLSLILLIQLSKVLSH